ncbi:head decoration protein (plasmid) [Halomonas qaidamensis]|uniref:Head decoration protein n=1 Tax=Halomonas qaidamensis TaxID=2866211 RepID=A0ABY6JVQ4_9GAMM|nr:head decoration protein [Halomonas qaidamensis]UYV20921.1 head decoration protein [Halomonas qaidamensis]
MPTKTHIESTHTGEHILSEASGARSRESGMLASGNLPAGAVLAMNGAGDYVPLAPAAADGTEVAKAVLYGAADASETPQPITVHVRACEVHGALLGWPEAADEAAITAGTNDLVSRGVIVRD